MVLIFLLMKADSSVRFLVILLFVQIGPEVTAALGVDGRQLR